MRKLILCWLILAVTAVSIVAQDRACPAIVETALTTVDRLCADVGRNQACYGHVSLNAEPVEEVTDLLFDTPGNIEPLVRIRKMSLSNMDPITGAWGVSLMKVQANLPDTLPGQNVTFLLFGDTEVTNISGDLQVFYLRTGIGDAACAEAPNSGILMQTPQGTGLIDIQVNGIDIQMGSTLFLQAAPNQSTLINVLEGQAGVSALGVTRDVPAGFAVVVPMDAELNPSLPPLEIQPIDPLVVQGLPLVVLPLGIDDVLDDLSPATPENPISATGVYHIVRRGENLFRIALHYRTTIQSIVDANRITNRNLIYVGQVLFIPNPGFTGPPDSPLLAPTSVFTPTFTPVPSTPEPPTVPPPPTNTDTPSATNTPVFTSTSVFTPTDTATGTWTFTPTNTPTDTPTGTPAFTPTHTPTATETDVIIN